MGRNPFRLFTQQQSIILYILTYLLSLDSFISSKALAPLERAGTVVRELTLMYLTRC